MSPAGAGAEDHGAVLGTDRGEEGGANNPSNDDNAEEDMDVNPPEDDADEQGEEAVAAEAGDRKSASVDEDLDGDASSAAVNVAARSSPSASPAPSAGGTGGSSTRRGGTRGSTKAAAAAAAAASGGTTGALELGTSSSSATATATTGMMIMDAATQAAFVQAAAFLQQRGYPAVAALLNSSLAAASVTTAASGSGGGGGGAASSASSSSGAAAANAAATSLQLLGDSDALVTGQLANAVESSATKLVAESPPWVHWSKADSAPQLKIAGGPSKTTLLGGYRGYRMGRATAGLSSGYYYYEAVILPAPTAQEIYSQLPPSARLGPGLEAMLKLQNEQEEKERERKELEQLQKESAMGSSTHSTATETDIIPPGKRVRVGGHVRLGWSMRTGELQAPVGYDKWSYAIRDIGGSLVHKSFRQDSWWSGYDSIEFGPGDVVGCALCLDADEPHIRFFLNGECLGNFVISKGKRVGGVAFVVEPGCYYPAVSLYMGGGVRANFGPHWIYPPRKLPTGFPKLQPVSTSVAVPKSPSDAVEACGKALKLLHALRRSEYAKAVKAAIEVEAKVQCDAYDKYYLSLLEFVSNEREDRGLTTADLKEKLQQLQQQQGKIESAGPEQ